MKMVIGGVLEFLFYAGLLGGALWAAHDVSSGVGQGAANVGTGIGNGIAGGLNKVADELPDETILIGGLAFIGYGIYKVANL